MSTKMLAMIGIIIVGSIAVLMTAAMQKAFSDSWVYPIYAVIVFSLCTLVIFLSIGC